MQDNVIFERLTEASQYKDLTVAHLEQFATEGKKEEIKRRGRHVRLTYSSGLLAPVKYKNLAQDRALITSSSSHSSRPEDSVFCLCGPGGRSLPGVAEGI